MEADYREFEAKTVDEAIVAAMRAFRTDFESLDIQVISEGSKGLFGLVGSKSAKILARPARKEEGADRENAPQMKKEEVESAPKWKHEIATEEAPERPALEETSREPVQASPEILEKARQVVSDILKLMNISGDVRIREDNIIDVAGDGSGLLIGKRGATIDSLQFIVNRILNKDREEPVYVTIDTEGYRKRHVEHLKSMAIKIGQKVKRTGQSMSLEKMNPYDRRIVHLALKNDTRVSTKSIGEGIYKKVVILPTRKASRS